MVSHQASMKQRRPRRRRVKGKKLATVATVKRLISGQEETKKFWVGMGDFKPGSRRVYAVAPFREIVQGQLNSNRIADQIQKIKLHLSLSWTAYGLNSLSDTKLTTGMPLRCMVVRSRNEITGLSGFNWTQITYDAATNTQLPLFANTVQTVNSLLVPHPDYKVIKQVWLKSESLVTSQIAGTTVFKQFTVSIPKYSYDPIVGTGFSKGYNYYVVVTTSGGQDVPDNSTNGSLQCHYMITFKDA